MGDVEGAFESDAGAAEKTFIEELADERDAVGDSARRVEFGQGMSGIGSPVTARLCDLHEAGTEGERRVAGEVGEGQYLISQGWDEKQINLRKDAGHFECDLATETISLDKIDGGKKARLTECVGP